MPWRWSCFLVCDSLWPHGLQHARLPCPSPIPGVCSNSCPTHHQLTELVISSNHLILCCHLLLLPSIFYSIKVFPNESALCIQWPKYWSFSFSISPSNEYSGLVSFRIDWFDLLQELSIGSVETGWGAFMAKPWRRVELSGWRRWQGVKQMLA